jgi:hypothetical protein
MLACCPAQDSGAVLLAAVVGGVALLAAAEPAAAADGAARLLQPVGELAENQEFWGNVLRYISYFFSVMLGTGYIMLKPFAALLKRPVTAVLLLVGVAALLYFINFTVQSMLGVNEVLFDESTSFVTPAGAFQ